MSGQELWQLDDEELLAALVDGETALRRAYAQQLELLGELLGRNQVHGYRSVAHLLQDLVRVSRAEAQRRVAHAEAVTAVRPLTGPPLLPPLPATAEAMQPGAIGAEHLEVIRRTMKELPSHVDPQGREVAERTLVDAARELDPVAVTRLGRSLLARLDQDGPPPDDEALPPRPAVNELRWTTRRNGDLELKGRLGAEGAALLTSVLSPLAKPRPAADGTPDPRTSAERQGDAHVPGESDLALRCPP
jgi:Domain of unknown function (DUF222)